MNTNKIILFLINSSLIIFLNYSYSQNLVPNPGFEVIDSCNFYAPNMITLATPWDNPTNTTPDLYNVCSTMPWNSVPTNCGGNGYQVPHSGNGYAGAGFYDENYMEYIQVQLNSVLQPQIEYCVNFYVSCGGLGNAANNNIGMYFSPTHISVSTLHYLNFPPQVNDTMIISDTSNWTLISGQFVAQGGEEYILIGNFFPDSLTDTISFPSHPPGAQGSYYYIDDISVMRCDAGVGEVIKEEALQIMPNPSSGIFIIKSTPNKIIQLRIRDILGREVLNMKPNNFSTTIDISPQPAGQYYIEATTEKGIIRKRFLKE